MSLLSVTVKKAHYVGPQAAQFNTYVTLKLQNVKSTTVTVKGADPCWEQDFLFETNDVTAGLLVEVWNKGMIWDRAIGYHWLPLPSVHISNEEGCGRWVPLAGELVVRGSEVVGTAGATGHALLLDCRFELPFGDGSYGVWRSWSLASSLRLSSISPYEPYRPFEPYESYRPYKPYEPYRTGGLRALATHDAEGTEAAELQRKLDLLNCLAGQERADQARRQLQYTAHSGYSEDSDYTSDLNYPVGQHANSSASQFRAAAHQLHTPQRSLETSRENSYERDEVMYGGVGPGGSRGTHDDGYGGGVGSQRWDHDPEPLYYNSRPRYHQEHGRRRKHDWDDDDRLDGWRQNQLCGQLSMESEASFHSAIGPPTRRARGSPTRGPSLERQNTLYDDAADATPTFKPRDQSQFSQQPSYEEFYDTNSFPFQGEEDYTTNEEDRQWAGGGYYFGQDYSNADRSSVTTTVEYENSINKRRSSVIQLPQLPTKVRPQSVISDPYGVTPRKSFRRATSRTHGRVTPDVTSRGASLPATPPGTPRMPRQLPRPPAPSSLPPAPTTPRMLPRPPTATSQIYDSSKFYSKAYNEDYNYGYNSLEDNQVISFDGADTTDFTWPRKRLPSVTETPRKLPAPPMVPKTNQIYPTDIIQDQTPYVQDQDSYIIDKQLFNQEQLSYNQDQLSFNQDQLSYNQDQLSYNQTQPSYTLEKTPYIEDQPYVDNQQSYITDQQPYIEDKPSYIEDQQPYIEDQQPYIEDQQPYTNDSFYDDSQTYVEKDKPYIEDQNYIEDQEYVEDQPSFRQDETSYSFDKPSYQTEDASYNHEETPYYDETQPYYDDQEPYHKDLPPYQQDTQSYQQDAQQYQSNQLPVVTSSYQESNYISDNRVPYSTSQWIPQEPQTSVPVTSGMKFTTDVPKSLPTSQPTTSTPSIGIAGAPVVAAVAAQTFGRLMASGAQKLGGFLSSVTPKAPTAPVSAPTPAPVTSQSSITRPPLHQQVSVTESDSYLQYPQVKKDSVPMNNYVHPTDISVSEANDDYGYNNSMDRDLVKQDSLDYNVQDEDPSGRDYLRKQDSLPDRGYLQNQNSIDSYGPDDLDALNGVSSDYGKTSHDSPVSVIHVDRLEPISGSIDDEDMRSRGRGLENSLVEPYRPKPMSPLGSRKTSMEVTYNENIDVEPLVPGLQEMLPEPTGSPPPDIRAPQDFRGEAEIGSLIGSGSEEKAKSVSFEDEEADRCPVDARGRWLWAFRKINVSKEYYIL